MMATAVATAVEDPFAVPPAAPSAPPQGPSEALKSQTTEIEGQYSRITSRQHLLDKKTFGVWNNYIQESIARVNNEFRRKSYEEPATLDELTKLSQKLLTLNAYLDAEEKQGLIGVHAETGVRIYKDTEENVYLCTPDPQGFADFQVSNEKKQELATFVKALTGLEIDPDTAIYRNHGEDLPKLGMKTLGCRLDKLQLKRDSPEFKLSTNVRDSRGFQEHTITFASTELEQQKLTAHGFGGGNDFAALAFNFQRDPHAVNPSLKVAPPAQNLALQSAPVSGAILNSLLSTARLPVAPTVAALLPRLAAPALARGVPALAAATAGTAPSSPPPQPAPAAVERGRLGRLLHFDVARAPAAIYNWAARPVVAWNERRQIAKVESLLREVETKLRDLDPLDDVPTTSAARTETPAARTEFLRKQHGKLASALSALEKGSASGVERFTHLRNDVLSQKQQVALALKESLETQIAQAAGNVDEVLRLQKVLYGEFGEAIEGALKWGEVEWRERRLYREEWPVDKAEQSRFADARRDNQLPAAKPNPRPPVHMPGTNPVAHARRDWENAQRRYLSVASGENKAAIAEAVAGREHARAKVDLAEALEERARLRSEVNLRSTSAAKEALAKAEKAVQAASAVEKTKARMSLGQQYLAAGPENQNVFTQGRIENLERRAAMAVSERRAEALATIPRDDVVELNGKIKTVKSTRVQMDEKLTPLREQLKQGGQTPKDKTALTKLENYLTNKAKELATLEENLTLRRDIVKLEGELRHPDGLSSEQKTAKQSELTQKQAEYKTRVTSARARFARMIADVRHMPRTGPHAIGHMRLENTRPGAALQRNPVMAAFILTGTVEALRAGTTADVKEGSEHSFVPSLAPELIGLLNKNWDDWAEDLEFAVESQDGKVSAAGEWKARAADIVNSLGNVGIATLGVKGATKAVPVAGKVAMGTGSLLYRLPVVHSVSNFVAASRVGQGVGSAGRWVGGAGKVIGGYCVAMPLTQVLSFYYGYSQFAAHRNWIPDNRRDDSTWRDTGMLSAPVLMGAGAGAYFGPLGAAVGAGAGALGDATGVAHSLYKFDGEEDSKIKALGVKQSILNGLNGFVYDEVSEKVTRRKRSIKELSAEEAAVIKGFAAEYAAHLAFPEPVSATGGLWGFPPIQLKAAGLEVPAASDTEDDKRKKHEHNVLRLLELMSEDDISWSLGTQTHLSQLMKTNSGLATEIEKLNTRAISEYEKIYQKAMRVELTNSRGHSTMFRAAGDIMKGNNIALDLVVGPAAIFARRHAHGYIFGSERDPTIQREQGDFVTYMKEVREEFSQKFSQREKNPLEDRAVLAQDEWEFLKNKFPALETILSDPKNRDYLFGPITPEAPPIVRDINNKITEEEFQRQSQYRPNYRDFAFWKDCDKCEFGQALLLGPLADEHLGDLVTKAAGFLAATP